MTTTSIVRYQRVRRPYVDAKKIHQLHRRRVGRDTMRVRRIMIRKNNLMMGVKIKAFNTGVRSAAVGIGSARFLRANPALAVYGAFGASALIGTALGNAYVNHLEKKQTLRRRRAKRASAHPKRPQQVRDRRAAARKAMRKRRRDSRGRLR
jgi:hypothetical protein